MKKLLRKKEKKEKIYFTKYGLNLQLKLEFLYSIAIFLRQIHLVDYFVLQLFSDDIIFLAFPCYMGFGAKR